MANLKIKYPNEEVYIEICEQGFNIIASDLLDAIHLFLNTIKELEDDACILLPEEQGKILALFYTSTQGGKWKRLKHPIYKEGFTSASFVSIPHTEYSTAFGYEIQNEVLLVGETIPVYALTFSDGSRYYHGKQKAFDDRVISQAELIILGKQIDNQA